MNEKLALCSDALIYTKTSNKRKISEIDNRFKILGSDGIFHKVKIFKKVKG